MSNPQKKNQPRKRITTRVPTFKHPFTHGILEIGTSFPCLNKIGVLLNITDSGVKEHRIQGGRRRRF